MSLTGLRTLPDTSQIMDLTPHEIHREDLAVYQQGLIDLVQEKVEVCQRAVGKKTARERIAELLDEGSFTEIGRFYGGNIVKGFTDVGAVTGIGTVVGESMAVYAQGFSVQGSTLGEVEGNRIITLMGKVLELRVPTVVMLDSGGVRIQGGMLALSQCGRIFEKICEASGVIPQIFVTLGSCAGGVVYCPALTDSIVIIRDNPHMFVTGPDVVRATTGENVSFADLGGAEVHNFQSEVVHYLADDKADAFDYTRTLLIYLPPNCEGAARRWNYEKGSEDAINTARLSQIVPESPKQPYDMVEVIHALADCGEFVQVQEMFVQSITVGFAAFDGEPVGIVANNPIHGVGTLGVNALEKTARLAQFCDVFNVPIATLVGVPGYRSGTEQEYAGTIRRGAKFVWSYATATVPLATVTLRKVCGGTYVVMGSKSLGGDFNYTRPGAEIAVFGADDAVAIAGRCEPEKAAEGGKDVTAVKAELVGKYTHENVNPYLPIESGQFDAIITPETTRSSTVSALRIARTENRS